MHKLLSLAMTSIVSAGLVLTTSPAQAGTVSGPSGYSVRVDDVVYDADGCVRANIYFTPPSDPALRSYNADVSITAPDGSDEGGGYFYEDDTSPGYTTLCEGIDPFGRYTVTVDFQGQDADYNQVTESQDTTSFSFGRSAGYQTSLTAAKSTLGRHGWRVRGHLIHGGRPWVERTVFLQFAYGGTWHNLSARKPYARKTDGSGNVIFRSVPRRGAARIRLRLHADGSPSAAEANSPEFRLPKR